MIKQAKMLKVDMDGRVELYEFDSFSGKYYAARMMPDYIAERLSLQSGCAVSLEERLSRHHGYVNITEVEQ